MGHLRIRKPRYDANDGEGEGREKKRYTYETTWRCQKNPFIGALGIQEPVIPGEPLFIL